MDYLRACQQVIEVRSTGEKIKIKSTLSIFQSTEQH